MDGDPASQRPPLCAEVLGFARTPNPLGGFCQSRLFAVCSFVRFHVETGGPKAPCARSQRAQRGPFSAAVRKKEDSRFDV